MEQIVRPQPGNRVRIILDATVLKDIANAQDTIYINVTPPHSFVAQRLRVPLSAVQCILETTTSHEHAFTNLAGNGETHNDRIHQTQVLHQCSCGASMETTATRYRHNGAFSREIVIKEADGTESSRRKTTHENARSEEALLRDIVDTYRVIALDTPHASQLPSRAEQTRLARWSRKLAALKSELGRDISEEQAIALYQQYRQRAS